MLSTLQTGVYICDECGQSFVTDDALSKHANSEHLLREIVGRTVIKNMMPSRVTVLLNRSPVVEKIRSEDLKIQVLQKGV